MQSKDRHNFHVSCPKAWRYTGDVNLEYGGTFFKVADLEAFIADPRMNDTIETVRVESTPWGWWMIEAKDLFMGGDRRLSNEQLANEYGLNLTDLEADPLALAQLHAEFVVGCWGLEAEHPQAVMIGAHEGRAETDQFGRWKLVNDGRQWIMPLTKLPANARLSNFVRREYLEN